MRGSPFRGRTYVSSKFPNTILSVAFSGDNMLLHACITVPLLLGSEFRSRICPSPRLVNTSLPSASAVLQLIRQDHHACKPVGSIEACALPLNPHEQITLNFAVVSSFTWPPFSSNFTRLLFKNTVPWDLPFFSCPRDTTRKHILHC